MAQVPTTAISRIQSEIEQNWHRQNEFAQKTVEAIVKIGQLLLRADAHFRKTDDKVGLLEFEGTLPFSKSTASKYRQIAANDALVDKACFHQLPSSIHSLYELSQLDPKELRQGIKSGTISAESNRSQIAEYASKRKALAPSGGGAGRPRKRTKTTYEELLTIKIDKSTLQDERQELIDAFRKLAVKRPDVQCVFSKHVISERLKELRQEADDEFSRLQDELAPENKFLVNLVDRAIEAARKNNGAVPTKFEWRGRLKKELGLNVDGEIRIADLYKVAKEREIVSRFVPLKTHSEVIKTHIYVMNYCDGKKSALKLLQKIADGTLSKAKDRVEVWIGME
jgi:hypothetical protein